MSKPVIFISAVSKELRSARTLVAQTLLALGYEPKWQDISATDTGDLRGVLRKWVDESDAVLQLVGHCYGFAHKEPDPHFGECSYTQYEALYARQQEKPVYYIFTDADHPTDGCASEPQILHDLQEKYRQTVKSYGDLYHSTSSLTQTELLVRRLKDDLAHLRKRGKRHSSLVLGLLLVLVLGIGWLKRDLWQQTKQLDSVLQHNKQMELALIKLADTEMHAKQFGENLTPEQLRLRAYTLLENELGIAAGTLSRELPGFALELFNRPDTTLLMRAHAAYALNKFAEAEKLFLESEAQDKNAMDNAEKVFAELREKRIAALVGAGQSAEAQIHYPHAMEHYLAAVALTSKERDILQWLSVQNTITYLFSLQGQYSDGLKQAQQIWQTARQAGKDDSSTVLAAHMYFASALRNNGQAAAAELEHRAVIQVQERVLGEEHHDTLMSRMNLAIALKDQGKYAESEQENRTVLKVRERLLGIDHPDTLMSRMNLANVLLDQGKYSEAEHAHRGVLKERERLLGKEHPDSLGTRMNLANSLDNQGKHAEAEQEYRAVLEVQKRVLGAEHSATISSQMNLANSLDNQGKHAEAEQEYRAVLEVKKRVLGAEHPDTLRGQMNLAIALNALGRHAEAEQEYRVVLELQERVLGIDHPDTLMSRMNLANALYSQKKYTDAEQEHRAVLEVQERVLGEEHPTTLASRVNLGTALQVQGKHVEAEQEYRAALRLQERVLGAEHPATMASRKGVAITLKTQGKYADAEQEYRALLKLQEKTLGAEHPDVARSCYNLALCLADQQKLLEALEFMQRAEQARTKVFGADHPDTQRAKSVRERIEAELK